jgi:hypothetical protein
MKSLARSLPIVAALSLAGVAACKSGDDGTTHVSAGAYYGTEFHDPWYYGHYDDDVDIIVTPPDRPVDPPKPTHPIVLPPTPPPRPTPMPMPMPSIPRMPAPRVR